jgi:hypothetical protein
VATYALMGRQGMDGVTVRLAVGPSGGPPVAESAGPATREGQLALPIAAALALGDCRATLTLHDRQGREIDRRQMDFRVIESPF